MGKAAISYRRKKKRAFISRVMFFYHQSNGIATYQEKWYDSRNSLIITIKINSIMRKKHKYSKYISIRSHSFYLCRRSFILSIIRDSLLSLNANCGSHEKKQAARPVKWTRTLTHLVIHQSATPYMQRVIGLK